MTLNNAIKTLTALRDDVARDGKVSLEETGKLLEFIEPYTRANNKVFESFQKSVLKAREDGAISDEESRLITYDIENMLTFLKTERVIEFVFGVIVIGIIVLGVCHLVFV